MSEERFLNSSPRQIKTLTKFHKNFSKTILVDTINEYINVLADDEDEYEYVEIESIGDI